jgi:hypothetical protein
VVEEASTAGHGQEAVNGSIKSKSNFRCRNSESNPAPGLTSPQHGHAAFATSAMTSWGAKVASATLVEQGSPHGTGAALSLDRLPRGDER